jgi:translation initiation factor 4E
METETTKFMHSWILWYHDPENNDYSLNGYVRIAELTTPQQFWTVVDTIPQDAWECGMFFFMREGIKPLWDSPENEHGGSWSKKVDIANIRTIFVDLMVHCVTNELLVKRKECLAGITVSPKGQFSIIKVWNTNTSIHDKTLLNPKMKHFAIGEDVTYTAHKSRRR